MEERTTHELIARYGVDPGPTLTLHRMIAASDPALLAPYALGIAHHCLTMLAEAHRCARRDCAECAILRGALAEMVAIRGGAS